MHYPEINLFSTTLGNLLDFLSNAFLRGATDVDIFHFSRTRKVHNK